METPLEATLMRAGDGTSFAAIAMGYKCYRPNRFKLDTQFQSLSWYSDKNKLIASMKLGGDEDSYTSIRVPVGTTSQKYPILVSVHGPQFEAVKFACSSEEERLVWLKAMCECTKDNDSSTHFDDICFPGPEEELDDDADLLRAPRQPFSDDRKDEIFAGMMMRAANVNPEECEDFDATAFFASHAEEDGGWSRDTFNTLFATTASNGVMQAFGFSADDKTPLIGMVMQMGLPEEGATKLVDKVSLKIMEHFPVLANCIFNFFDMDGGGSVSQLELRNAAVLFFTMREILGKSKNADVAVTNIDEVVDAIFRICDTDGNGSVESKELADIVGSIIGNLLLFVVTILTDIAPYVVAGPVEGAVRSGFPMLIMMLNGSSEGEPPEELPLAALADFVVAQATAPNPWDEMMGIDPSTRVSGLVTNVKKALSAALPVLGPCLDVLGGIFTQHAEDGEIDKAKLVDLVMDTVNPMVAGMLESSEEIIFGYSMGLMETVNFSESTTEALTNGLKSFSKALSSVAAELQSSGAVKDYIAALLDMLDVNNDGSMSRDEVMGFSEAFLGVASSFMAFAGEGEESVAEMSAALTGLLMSFAKLADENNDGALSPSEVCVLVRKLVAFVLAIVKMFVATLKAILKAILEPAFNLAMTYKESAVGGDATSFTKDDLRALFVTEVSYLCKNRF